MKLISRKLRQAMLPGLLALSQAVVPHPAQADTAPPAAIAPSAGAAAETNIFPVAALPDPPAPIPPNWREARLSLSLQPTPLHEALGFLSLAHNLKFVYGALPDAVVRAHFDGAPLLPALQALLNGTGFEMRLVATPAAQPDEKESLWIFRRPDAPLLAPASGVYAVSWTAQSTPALQTQPEDGVAWELWTRDFAPPAGWNLLPAVDGVVGLPIDRFAQSSAGWSNARLRPQFLAGTENRAPTAAVAVQAADSTPADSTAAEATAAEAAASDGGELFLRWQMQLRTVPRGAQLLLLLPRPATFTVNGATLFRVRSGPQRLNLDRLLRLGPNNLALHFPPLAKDTDDAPSADAPSADAPSADAPSADAPSADAPLLYYVWLLPGKSATEGAAAAN